MEVGEHNYEGVEKAYRVHDMVDKDQQALSVSMVDVIQEALHHAIRS